MALTAQSIIHRAVITLQDTTSVRWPVDELVRYLNDGQREVILYRPDASVTNATITCVEGSKQSTPSDSAKLMDVVRNAATGSNGRAVRLTNRVILDAQIPEWYTLTPSINIKHYMYDPKDVSVFYVYPPATDTAQLDIVYSSFPADIAEPSAGSEYTDVSGNIDLPDIYGNVLLDYVLYKAYSKDSEYSGNAARAQAHYGAFANALNIEIQGTIGASPTNG